MSNLEEEFEHEMLDRYGRAVYKATHYRPTRMIEMIQKHGALETVRILMHQYKEHPSDGYTKLWENKRLDLSFEALMHDARFACLFTQEELEWACKRLADYNYTPPGGCKG